MKRVTIVDGGWRGHRLALISTLLSALSRQGIRSGTVIAEPAMGSAEAAVHLTRGQVVAEIPSQQNGVSWWHAALDAVPKDTDLVILPKCDNVVGYPSCTMRLQDAPWRTSGLLLKIAPDQDRHLRGDARRERANRLQRALAAARSGALDQLVLLCGYGDSRPGPVPHLEAVAVSWAQDVPLLSDAVPCGRPWKLPYALIAGEVSWRKRVVEVLQIWPEVFARTGVGLALVGCIHESVRDSVEAAASLSSTWLAVRDEYVPTSELMAWHRHAAVVLGTFDSSQYAPSGAVAIAQNYGTPVLTYGNLYVDMLVKRLGGGCVLESMSAVDVARGVGLAVKERPVPSLVDGAGRTLRTLADALLAPLAWAIA